MKMYAVLFATLLIVGCSHGSPMANYYLDSILSTSLRYEILAQSLDPATVPEFSTTFEDRVTIVGKVKGKAKYSEGNLTGLSQVKRYSDCQGPYYGYGSKSVNCSLVFEKLSINYDGKLKYGKMPKVHIRGSSNITNSVVFVEISQNVPLQPFVKNFMFQKIGMQEIEHTGLGPLNKYMKILDDAFGQHVQAEIFNSISQRFQFALNRAAAALPLPNF